MGQRQGVSDGGAYVSYTQFSMYQSCPHSWELAYGRKLKTDVPSINFVFGNAMHVTIQSWLTKRYDKSLRLEPFDMAEELLIEMQGEFSMMIEKAGDTFSSPEELTEYYYDGVGLLKQIKSERFDLYDTNETKLVGVEVPVSGVPSPNRDVKLIGYLDIVLSVGKDVMYLIQDIKTSTNGWSSYQKSDNSKLSQLLLYKYFFSLNHGIPLGKITSQYVILVRKPEPKIEIFIPKQTTSEIKKVANELTAFVEDSFHEDGSVNLDRTYPAVSGYGNERCKFCEFRERYDLCPVESRIPDIVMAKQ